MKTRLPCKVKEFTNASGTISFRVSGTVNGERIRQNFPTEEEAQAFCDQKNADALNASGGLSLAQTRLSVDALTAAEAGVARIAGRWPLGQVIDAGIRALESTPASEPLAPLYLKWLEDTKPQVDERWHADLKGRVGAFLKAHPEITTADFTPEKVGAYLDKIENPGTRANHRNCLHHFGRWLMAPGRKKIGVNPAAGLWIRRKSHGVTKDVLPPVLSPLQANAFMRAVTTAECRRLKGWATSCLFAGLRPESEAERLLWAEVNLKTEELRVMGRKRGASPRLFKLQPTAVEWLKDVKNDKEETPAPYWRHLRIRAVKLANEWLAKHHPKEPPIKWESDILRHSYASYRAGQGVPIDQLAEEMGTSTSMIYGHYRHPRTAAQVKAFWASRPGAMR